MKRLECKWWDDFDKMSDWLLDQNDVEVINIQKDENGWWLFYWEIT